MLPGALAMAAPLAGTVMDGKSLQPIAGARIQVSGGEASTVADATGRFQFPDLAPGTIQLSIEADGYEPGSEEVELDQTGRRGLIIILFHPGEYAELIEVTEQAPEDPDSPGEQKLERQELVRIPGARGDALTTLKNLPGVASVDAAGSGPGMLVIRGSAPEDSKITIDGIEVPLLYHFFGLQSIIPSEFIESIDFQPGGFGVKEGRATGGLININTRSNEVSQLTGFAELSFINVAGFVQGPVSQKHHLHFSAGIRRSTIDLLLPIAIPDSVNLAFVTAPQYYDAQLRFDWRPRPEHHVFVFGMLSYDLLSLVNDEINPNEPLLTGKFDNSTAFDRVIARWRYLRQPIDSRLVLSAGTGDLRLEIGSERHLMVAGIQIEGREDVDVALLPELKLQAGVELRYGRGDVDVLMPLMPGEGSGGEMSFSTAPVVAYRKTTTNNTAGAYVATRFEPTPGMVVTPGLRVDYYDRIDATTWLPRVTLEDQLSADWTLRAGLGAYSRPLQGDEAVATYLEPELATQYVVGADYDIGQGISASGSAFYTDRRQLVVQDPALAATDPINAFVNRGFGRSFGVEGLIRVKRRDLFGWVAYTLSRSDRIDGPESERRLFDYDQTHNLIAVASYTLGPWSFGGRWQFSTGTPMTPIVGSMFQADYGIYLPLLGPINSARLESGHQLDVRIDRKFRFRTWSLSAYLDVTNVYYHPRTLGYRYNFDYSEKEALKELPILPALGVRGTF